MAMAPGGECRGQKWIGSILQVWAKDLANQVRATSSRGQLGRGCKRGCPSDAKPSGLHRERSLKPHGFCVETHIADVTDDRAEKRIICFKVR